MFGNLVKRDTPMVPGNHPEIDNSEVLNAYAVSLFACFAACSRKGHNIRALYSLGYLKKKPNRRIRVNHRDPGVVKNGAESQLEVDLLAKMREHYPEAEENIDDQLPKPFFNEFAITAYVDSDHTHNKLTR
eukprot:4435070-Ditylum_brightwellii.AAC.1